jgi:hypothetical protein
MPDDGGSSFPQAGEPPRTRPSTTSIRIRRSASPLPQVDPPPVEVLAFIEGEDTSKRALGEAHVPQPGPRAMGEGQTRHARLLGHLDDLRGALAAASWDRISPRLAAAPFYAHTLDHLLGDRSLHLYAIASLDDAGAETGVQVNGALRALLGDRIAAATTAPGLLRALCDPQDAEAFLDSAWPSLVESPPGACRRDVLLRLPASRPPASATDHASLRRLASEIIERIDKLAQVLTRRRSHATPTPSAPGDDAQVVRQIDLGLSALVDRERKRGLAIDLAARIEQVLQTLPAGGHLALTCTRIPGGVAICGTLVAAAQADPARLEERRFRYRPSWLQASASPVLAAIADLQRVIDGARSIQDETRRLSALAPADPAAAERLRLNEVRAQCIVAAAQAIAAEVLWPMAALVEAHPMPVQVHGCCDGRYVPIAFSGAFEAQAGIAFAQASDLVRANVDYLAAICDDRNLKDLNDQQGLMRLGYSPGFERTVAFRSGARLFLRGLMADPERTTEVCEGRPA